MTRGTSHEHTLLTVGSLLVINGGEGACLDCLLVCCIVFNRALLRMGVCGCLFLTPWEDLPIHSQLNPADRIVWISLPGTVGAEKPRWRLRVFDFS